VSDSPPRLDQAGDPVLEALWARALEAWHDDKAHAALLDRAIHAQALPDIAGRYRRFADDPEKGPIARKRLDAIVASATQMLLASKTPPQGKVPLSITLTAAAVSALLLAWLAYALWGQR